MTGCIVLFLCIHRLLSHGDAFQSSPSLQRISSPQLSRSNYDVKTVVFNSKQDETFDDDDDDDDDGFINASDNVNFEEIDKLFDDVPNYGVIRSLESPYENYNPVDPLSVDEIELWMQKNQLYQQKQEKNSRRKLLFPWLGPITRLFLPRKYTPSTRNVVGNKEKRGNNDRYIKRKSLPPISFQHFWTRPNSARNILVALNILAYVYQIATAVRFLPGFNRVLAMSVAGDACAAVAAVNNIPQWTTTEVVLRALGFIGGGAGIVISSGSNGMRGGRGPIAAHSMGPFFLDNAHQPFPLSHFQKHRYLSSGFLHGSFLHLFMNLRAMLSLPSWLENGIGKGVYLTAYLTAIVTGNIAHTMSTIGDLSGRAASQICIGASGGICGLYGLMLASLMKMGNDSAVSVVLRQMLWLLAFGFLVPNVSNAGHVGGFLGGWLIGYLFGPGYERSYTLNRIGGGRDHADFEFRQMMGPGVYPSVDKAIFPLQYLWYSLGLILLAKPEYRAIPLSLMKGIIEPGMISGVRTLLR
jgi:membrane associated rhomboid family serine protease